MRSGGTSIAGRTALVTGGCGFIGQHLVRALLARGACRVVVLDSLRFGDPDHLAELGRAVTLVRFALGHTPAAELPQHLEGVDLLFHLAAEKHNASRDDPQSLLASNVAGTQALLAAAALAGVRKVVFSSSLYAHGRRHAPVLREDEIPRPDTVYGISKLAGEHLLREAERTHGMPWVALRYFFVYGPRQYPGLGYKSVIVHNLERVARGLPATVKGDGRQALDYVYVDDVVEATLLAMEADVSGEVMNVGSGQPTEIRTLLDVLVRVAGGPPVLERLPADETDGTFRVADIHRMQERLAFSPGTSLEEGLTRTHAWMREAAQA
ncbi:MAG: NAD-dependent epimerase/dehydratase family protein [bacterium]